MSTSVNELRATKMVVTSDMLVNRRKNKCPPLVTEPKSALEYENSFPSRVPLGFADLDDARLKEESVMGEELVLSELAERPPLASWRVADHTDVPEIENLVVRSNGKMKSLFSEPNIPDLIEKSCISPIQLNENNEIVSFTSAFAYPNIPAVPSFLWYPWLANCYKIEDVDPRNTFFIHYLVWDPDYEEDIMRLLLETIFMESFFLKSIIVIKPPYGKIPEILTEFFIQVLPSNAANYDCSHNAMQTLLICFRHTVMERLKIRLAIMEDHDDLLPILERQTKKLRELYGEYCVAEIIDYPGSPHRKVLVCESNGYAVGLMALNLDVDLKLLNNQFFIGVYNGLRKKHEKDTPPEEIGERFDLKQLLIPETIDVDLNIINSETMVNLSKWKPSLCALSSGTSTSESSSSAPSSTRDNDYTLVDPIPEVVRQSINVKLTPKFMAHALDIANSRVFSNYSDETERSEYGEGEVSSVKSELSLMSVQDFNIPQYYGDPNAFAIELFAMHEDFDERLSFDFLEAAFEVFPDLDYCILTVPSQVPSFPLLDSFVRATPRPLKRFRQELYVAHKSSVVMKFMRVRVIEKNDLDEVYKLLAGIQNQDSIFAAISNSCYAENSAYQSFCLICVSTIVGVSVVCHEDNIDYLKHHFHTEEHLDFDLHPDDAHAILKYLLLSPIYQTHGRFFLRDIMRMANVTSLYRVRYEELQVKYHEPSLGTNYPPSYFEPDDQPFALFHINTRICHMRQFTTNINIVIVGFCRTASSFLDTLLYAPSAAYLTYNNIVWVDPHGSNSELAFHKARELMFPFRGKYNRKYNAQISFKSYANFIFGVMTEINRSNKYIVINNDAIVYYDYLVLCCGVQHLVPVPEVRRKDLTHCQRSTRLRCSLYKYLVNQQPEPAPPETYPPNVFVLNTALDGTTALVTLQYMLRQRKRVTNDEKIIVYGHHIKSYCCIQGLLKFGVAPELIEFVEPFPNDKNSVTCFHNPHVDRAVVQALDKIGIKCHRGFILYDWKLCSNNQVKSATFHSNHRQITIQCLAMFAHEKERVADISFKAVNDASLVYDGRLVIDHNFRTNDPYIYAAGPFTKYKRIYYAQTGHVNSVEVGSKLANVLCKKIDPTIETEPVPPSELIPKFKYPIFMYCQLPGDWNYFQLRPPGSSTRMEVHDNLKECGDLTTGDCQMSLGTGYFALKLDNHGFIKNITCFTKQDIDISNLTVLYGMHERHLNNLQLRFDLGLIPDLYAYFREPWVYAVYQDRYRLLLDENEDFFNDESIEDNDENEKLADYVTRCLEENNWQRLSDEKMEEITQRFNKSEVESKIKKNLLEFLLYYDEPFPMYATPRIVRVLLHGASTSILHKPLKSK